MSYQFEDESALEELLNQQLDRKKSQSARPAPLRSAGTIQARPSTATPQAQSVGPREPAAEAATRRKPSSLAGWLETPSGSQPAGDNVEPLTTTKQSNQQVETGKLDEEQLQEMSKQRLIRLIMGQLLPELKRAQESHEQRGAAELELENLRQELAESKTRLAASEARLAEQVELTERKWGQINRQLELRLEAGERESEELRSSQRTQFAQLEELHRRELAELAQNYKRRLEEERTELELQLKRRDEFHRLELESKLRVDCDLQKMETIFGEWDRRVRATRDELEQQFGRVEALLERQALEMNGTNSKLAAKSGELGKQLEQFERKTGELDRLAIVLGDCLPRFAAMQAQSESLTGAIQARLGELGERLGELRSREAELAREQKDLSERRERLQEERHECALEANRLVHLETRLGELEAARLASEEQLRERQRALEERERRLEALRANLEARSDQLHRENHELQLARSSASRRRQELARWARELGDERQAQRQRAAQLQADGARLDKVRAQARRELGELARLQGSLLCSLCLGQIAKTKLDNKWTLEELERPSARAEELERRQLRAESKYVELLQATGGGGGGGG